MLPLLSALASCSPKEGGKTFVIEDHWFVVPEDVLLPSEVAWFPSLQKSASLHFILDPAKPVGERQSVLAESRKITCRPDKIAPGSMLAEACVKGTGPLPPVETSSLRREPVHPSNKTLWVYTAIDADGSRAAVASCYVVAALNSGDSCSAFGR
jgi:hypothetical protein